jgi:hypothetical protein
VIRLSRLVGWEWGCVGWVTIKARIDEARAKVGRLGRLLVAFWLVALSGCVALAAHLNSTTNLSENSKRTDQPTKPSPPLLQGEPTVPSLLGEELDTNPFLRPGDPEIRRKVGAAPGDADSDVFGAVRRAKDGFRG